ncbi:protoporphyrinogen oxidase [Alkalihalobacillus sp. 1P02AB]|uniref:protoporphyrinogen oxidase n=1 Tax=Alkalihalobacillus sp. 1P02AB TaxID=3132260 RepID=UPI0039A6D78D
MDKAKKRKVAIVGGGLTGLAAAHKLQLEINHNQVPIEYQLFEASNRFGGKIKTMNQNGFVIEAGPDSYLARKKSMTRLAEQVGLSEQLINNETGQAFILKGKSLEPIPKGAIMGIPTQFSPFAQTNLLSPLGKLRVLADYFLPKTTAEDEDVSAGYFFRKRLGDEAVDYLIEPLLSGIYAGDMNKLSLKATFPQFQQLEKSHRSLIKGTVNNQKKAQLNQSEQPQKQKGQFLTFRDGLESFVTAIVEQFPQENLHLEKAIKKIMKVDSGYELCFVNGEVQHFDDVILTTPPHATGDLLTSYSEFQYLRKMELSTTATIAIAYREDDVQNPFDGTGFVVSRNSDVTITACTWTDKKWPHTTPEGYTLLRCYVGRAGDSAIVEKTDEEILQTVLDDLDLVMDISAEPLFFVVTRWREAMPQYLVGHPYKIAKLKEDLESKYPGLYIVGAAIDGVGLPDCIDQGEAAVDSILAKVAK